MKTKLSDKNSVKSEAKDTTCLTFKTVIPHKFDSLLDDLYSKCITETDKMLEDRTKSSTKYYKLIPSVVAKALIRKYQRNKKLKKIHRLVIPIFGEKGKHVKVIEDLGIRVPSIFKKEVLPAVFPKPIVGHIRSIEMFKRDKVWFMSYSYNTPKEDLFEPEGCIGVDRNSVGNVATISVGNVATTSTSDSVQFLGPDCASLNKNWTKRRAKLQKKGAKNALKKIKRKQSRRTKDINHKVSREIVNVAKQYRSAIVLEDLKGISTSKKTTRYVKKSQWSFSQLEFFIKYKAALLGIPIIYVSPQYTSQRCVQCGKLNKVFGKKYKCSCGYVAHRDINAAINIRKLGEESLSSNRLGQIGEPLNRIALVANVKPESLGGVQ